MSLGSRSLNRSLRLASFTAVLALFAVAAEAREEILRWRHSDPGRVAHFEASIGTTPGAESQVLNLGKPVPVDGVFYATITVSDDLDAYIRLRAVADDASASPFSAERMRPGDSLSAPVAGGTASPANPDAIARYDFGSDPAGTAVSGWVDTGANNSLVRDDTLFSVASIDGNRVLTTSSYATDIHSHRELQGVPYSLLTYTGRMATDRDSGALGVTAHSQYPLSNVYYRLGRAANGRFEITGHPDLNCANPDTGVTPAAGTWMRFEMTITEQSGSTRIDARVWPDGQARPVTAQAMCTDSSAQRSLAGTVGVWASGVGRKYWDDLEVTVPDGAPGSGTNAPPAPPVLLQIIPVEN